VYDAISNYAERSAEPYRSNAQIKHNIEMESSAARVKEAQVDKSINSKRSNGRFGRNLTYLFFKKSVKPIIIFNLTKLKLWLGEYHTMGRHTAWGQI
jgi:hypothetical protein